jgi:hypothetical protein
VLCVLSRERQRCKTKRQTNDQQENCLKFPQHGTICNKMWPASTLHGQDCSHTACCWKGAQSLSYRVLPSTCKSQLLYPVFPKLILWPWKQGKRTHSRARHSVTHVMRCGHKNMWWEGRVWPSVRMIRLRKYSTDSIKFVTEGYSLH